MPSMSQQRRSKRSQPRTHVWQPVRLNRRSYHLIGDPRGTGPFRQRSAQGAQPNQTTGHWQIANRSTLAGSLRNVTDVEPKSD